MSEQFLTEAEIENWTFLGGGVVDTLRERALKKREAGLPIERGSLGCSRDSLGNFRD